ncbi:SpoIIE family protein phosphatase [Actinomycetospora termitidis]|uniref:SpoIIE family protein phosphatase n=1 Tax=Actinomycetospora termitidis TaxID=3053470 RepID=A0ABT7MDK1_9PSEU|nr:SpoIIE family protein phosphatase [Actinomycetospora sp. Odt1-22]MDL5157453.1 SpoIIE family protein phosphatase [Actinomycetospora sp. Odt1-22]
MTGRTNGDGHTDEGAVASAGAAGGRDGTATGGLGIDDVGDGAWRGSAVETAAVDPSSFGVGDGASAPAGMADMADEAAAVRDGLALDAGGGDLPQVLHTAPAAVALIDLDAGTVTYANGSAQDLTGGKASLPLDIDAWSEAAGLTDLSGRPMRDTASPLSRVAQGMPVSGEPVAVADAARRGSEATAEEREEAEGRLLWVTGFPLSEAEDDERRRLALVVFLQLSGAGAQRHLEMMRDRAVVATELSFTISDPDRAQNPLVWVNPAFTRLTGYDLDEVLGRNCRFLQGPNTDPTSIARIRSALADERPITEVLLNYRRDGTAFWNQVSISPVFDGGGRVVNFVGVQADVTERVMVENERRAALAAAEETREQLRLLTDSTAAMTASLDSGGAARALARIVVPALADYCCVDLLEEVGDPSSAHRVAVNHRDDAKTDTVGALGRWITPTEDGDDPVDRVLAGGAPSLLPELPVRPDGLRDDGDLLERYEQLRPRSAIVVPLRARGQVLGALTLGTELPYGRRYSQRDLYLASDLAARAGLAVDNARLYAREHGAAETLQRSLLPAVPEVPGLTVASRYLAATDGAQVGGDWYDLLPLPDGAVGIAVGDVVGHDLRAAAAMGELRGVLRSYAWEGLGPDAVIDRCNDLVQGMHMAAMATAVFGRLERPADGEGWILGYCNAGHPPPLLRRNDGSVELLTGNLSPLIGATRAAERDCTEVLLQAGDLLVLHTDGLIEAPGLDPDERTDLLVRTLAEQDDVDDADAICDRILEVMGAEGLRDDAVLLAIRLS